MSDAAELSQTYFDLSKEMDEFRDTHDLDPDEQTHLKDLAHQLDDISAHFTIEDIAEKLSSIEDQVEQIKKVTASAKQSLKKLEHADEVIKVAAALVSLGLGAESGNVGTIGGALGDLAKLIPADGQAAKGGAGGGAGG